MGLKNLVGGIQLTC